MIRFESFETRRATPFLACLLTIGSALAVAPAGVSAQEVGATTMSPRVYADFQLGLFGDARAQSGDSSVSDELEPTLGGVGGFEIPIVPYFSMGAEAGFGVWNTDGGERWDVDPSLIVHLSVAPRFRLPWGGDTGGHGAFYVSGLFGPSINFLSGDVDEALSLGGASVDTGFGFNAGAIVGFQLFPIEHLGVDLGVGYQHHVVWHEVHGPFGGQRDVRVDFGQLQIRAGMAFSL